MGELVIENSDFDAHSVIVTEVEAKLSEEGGPAYFFRLWHEFSAQHPMAAKEMIELASRTRDKNTFLAGFVVGTLVQEQAAELDSIRTGFNSTEITSLEEQFSLPSYVGSEAGPSPDGYGDAAVVPPVA
jgi:hypothetical protein